MVNDLRWIRIEAARRDMALRDVAKRSGYHNAVFYKIIGGFQNTPLDFEERVRKVFDGMKIKEEVSVVDEAWISGRNPVDAERIMSCQQVQGYK